MDIYKVDFEYVEKGHIPYVVANSPDDAVEGAKLILAQQGLSSAKIIGATSMNAETVTEAGQQLN